MSDRQQKIHAIVSEWNDNDRIPVSFDDWEAQVIEDNDLEGWVEFNIYEYLTYTISDECKRDHGWIFSDEEVKIIEKIVEDVKEVMS